MHERDIYTSSCINTFEVSLPQYLFNNTGELHVSGYYLIVGVPSEAVCLAVAAHHYW